MNTETPETDAHQSSMEVAAFSVELAKTYTLSRKLERERNAAREALSGRTVSCSQCNELASKLVANEAYQMGLIAERDEAREAMENHLALTIHSCSPYCQRPLCVANRQIAEMREAIKEAWIEIQYAEAGFAGLALRVCPNDSAVESVLNRMNEAIAKLQPFLTL